MYRVKRKVTAANTCLAYKRSSDRSISGSVPSQTRGMVAVLSSCWCYLSPRVRHAFVCNLPCSGSWSLQAWWRGCTDLLYPVRSTSERLRSGLSCSVLSRPTVVGNINIPSSSSSVVRHLSACADLPPVCRGAYCFEIAPEAAGHRCIMAKQVSFDCGSNGSVELGDLARGNRKFGGHWKLV